ncbi:tRNA (guanosine(37)-N1)-methyltransferase TrmD [Candidatus Uhrbacteria bacterium RIFCSPHIGHO2_12_FULL_60_25]|uniref:tRNA (guanine-N(1)-)-methyltransferase n=1 Tax=Candidatus Uhrbacteria bacterium RIFCSPHIGHO2_12_FULL_60_25 TaxID=1802399 RepID=A0A1F7UL01_9BACT|nr:MAG: tRNA (guanosine(37)-N1)-methyltransferase TrmD [Candidatus Uhrbacteria bacterium RIFCSPHIGHO2_02_FULL_60_44]OGL78377.1 MAG: tRNA (guanosine(37)-N1)-methyltransferase TrmD [Candidatus Uhrbacteria bacterium RIFCSPHIGHO2_12_FULL_60_25]
MKKRPLRVDVITIFPEAFPGYLEASILGRAQKKRLLDVRVHQLRRWTHDRHKTVDDKPFGGGPGMVMKVQPFHEALVSLGLRSKKSGRKTSKAKKTRIIVTSASGKLFTHADAVRLSKYDRLAFLCGRYEGIDERVLDRLADEALSIGPYVLTGGELPALVMLDAIARQRPGVLGKQESLAEESWSDGGREYPHYTRPEVYLGMKVPSVLMGGNHKKIAEWRKEQRKK